MTNTRIKLIAVILDDSDVKESDIKSVCIQCFVSARRCLWACCFVHCVWVRDVCRQGISLSLSLCLGGRLSPYGDVFVPRYPPLLLGTSPQKNLPLGWRGRPYSIVGANVYFCCSFSKGFTKYMLVQYVIHFIHLMIL